MWALYQYIIDAVTSLVLFDLGPTRIVGPGAQVPISPSLEIAQFFHE